MSNSLYLSVVAAIMIAVACNEPSTPASQVGTAGSGDSSVFSLSQVRSEIDTLNRNFMDAIKKGDSAALATVYSDDAVLMPPNSEAVKSNGIAATWGSFLRMGVKEIKLTTDDLTGNKDLLAETGKYEIYADGQKMIDKGKYVVVWKPSNGNWKMFRDIFNTDMPVARGK
jgi:ketosteroid isomerase-like protein